MTETPAPRLEPVKTIRRRRPLTARRLALISGAVLALCGLGVLGLVALQYGYLSREGLDFMCSMSVGGLPIDEGSLVRGFWSWWPLGGACEWTLLDGTVILDLPDWSTTAVAVVGAALLVAGLALLVLGLLLRRRAA